MATTIVSTTRYEKSAEARKIDELIERELYDQENAIGALYAYGDELRALPASTTISFSSVDKEDIINATTANLTSWGFTSNSHSIILNHLNPDTANNNTTAEIVGINREFFEDFKANYRKVFNPLDKYITQIRDREYVDAAIAAHACVNNFETSSKTTTATTLTDLPNRDIKTSLTGDAKYTLTRATGLFPSNYFSAIKDCQYSTTATSALVVWYTDPVQVSALYNLTELCAKSNISPRETRRILNYQTWFNEYLKTDKATTSYNPFCKYINDIESKNYLYALKDKYDVYPDKFKEVPKSRPNFKKDFDVKLTALKNAIDNNSSDVVSKANELNEWLFTNYINEIFNELLIILNNGKYYLTIVDTHNSLITSIIDGIKNFNSYKNAVNVGSEDSPNLKSISDYWNKVIDELNSFRLATAPTDYTPILTQLKAKAEISIQEYNAGGVNNIGWFIRTAIEDISNLYIKSLLDRYKFKYKTSSIKDFKKYTEENTVFDTRGVITNNKEFFDFVDISSIFKAQRHSTSDFPYGSITWSLNFVDETMLPEYVIFKNTLSSYGLSSSDISSIGPLPYVALSIRSSLKILRKNAIRVISQTVNSKQKSLTDSTLTEKFNDVKSKLDIWAETYEDLVTAYMEYFKQYPLYFITNAIQVNDKTFTYIPTDIYTMLHRMHQRMPLWFLYKQKQNKSELKWANNKDLIMSITATSEPGSVIGYSSFSDMGRNDMLHWKYTNNIPPDLENLKGELFVEGIRPTPYCESYPSLYGAYGVIRVNKTLDKSKNFDIRTYKSDDKIPSIPHFALSNQLDIKFRDGGRKFTVICGLHTRYNYGLIGSYFNINSSVSFYSHPERDIQDSSILKLSFDKNGKVIITNPSTSSIIFSAKSENTESIFDKLIKLLENNIAINTTITGDDMKIIGDVKKWI